MTSQCFLYFYRKVETQAHTECCNSPKQQVFTTRPRVLRHPAVVANLFFACEVLTQHADRITEWLSFSSSHKISRKCMQNSYTRYNKRSSRAPRTIFTTHTLWRAHCCKCFHLVRLYGARRMFCRSIMDLTWAARSLSSLQDRSLDKVLTDLSLHWSPSVQPPAVATDASRKVNNLRMRGPSGVFNF